MSDGQKTVRLWDGSSDSVEPPLRRPNLPNQSGAGNVTTNSNPVTELPNSLNNSLNPEGDIVLKSNLSVDAKEWYPPNYNADTTTNRPRSSAQDRLSKIKQTPQTYVADNLQNGSKSLDETSIDLAKLQDIIGTLIEDPGLFDELCGTFIEIFQMYFEDIDAVSVAANMICDHALLHPNFRYNAARLCKLIGEQCPYFRPALHLICQKKVAELSYDYNVALFLAELFIQLNSDNLYGEFVIKMVKSVLSFGGVDNVKAVCQVLKLTGSSLETHYSQDINKIFDQLEIVKAVLPESTVNHINSVVILRASNWGQAQTNSTSSNLNLEIPTPRDGPILYGPDGKELTDEEKQFLSEYSYDSDVEGLWDPDPEMNEEVQAAFRQFLQLKK